MHSLPSNKEILKELEELLKFSGNPLQRDDLKKFVIRLKGIINDRLEQIYKASAHRTKTRDKLDKVKSHLKKVQKFKAFVADEGFNSYTERSVGDEYGFGGFNDEGYYKEPLPEILRELKRSLDALEAHCNVNMQFLKRKKGAPSKDEQTGLIVDICFLCDDILGVNPAVDTNVSTAFNIIIDYALTLFEGKEPEVNRSIHRITQEAVKLYKKDKADKAKMFESSTSP